MIDRFSPFLVSYPLNLLLNYQIKPALLNLSCAITAFILLIRDIPKIIKFKATNSLRVSCLFCIFKHSPQKTV